MTEQPFGSLKERQDRAIALLDHFSEFTEYEHGTRNPYLRWLSSNPPLTPEAVVDFLNFWYPVSRQQPQILLHVAASYPNWNDRKKIMLNYLEEDGMLQPGHQPHYVHLEKLIKKIGGRLAIDPEADALVSKFHGALAAMTPAEATGYVAAIEHPALDISGYFRSIIGLCGFANLLESDFYLRIHVDVEPDHILLSHGNALSHMANDSKGEILRAFQSAMTFWQQFWKLAFVRLGYPA